tara:strand:+ start:28373 stop:28627 length:255 start_codon:yes stop_codon:yes gene_type:complete
MPFVEVIETAHADGMHSHVRGVLQGYCLIYPREDGRGYVRETQFRSKHGRRYEWFRDYDKAVHSACKWARRRNQITNRERKADR